mgnify:CR=1 FL=1
MNFKKGSPESAGIPSGCLLHFLDRLQKKQVPMHSFLLMRHDTLIAEGTISERHAASHVFDQ